MAVHVLDDYYLGITAIVTVVYQLIFFSISYALKFDKLTDFAGGTNFVLLAVLTLGLSSTSGLDARQVVVSVTLILWALRLALFLAYRVHKTGKDDRFDDKRDNFLPLLGFWVFQMIWVFTISLPVTFLNSPAVQRFPQPAFASVDARDVVGLVMFTLGWAIESAADWQKFIFRETHKSDPEKPWCDKGVWAWSRHPNYFGEMLLQFGIYTMAVTPAFHGVTGAGAKAALNASIVGPILLTALLLFVSGLTLSERSGAKKRWEIGGNTWEGYKAYLKRTSILVPMPPALYLLLPSWLKNTLLMDWGMYGFDPSKHADAARQNDEEAPSNSRGESYRGGAEGGDERIA